MQIRGISNFASALIVLTLGAVQPALAITQPVQFNVLNASATLSSPFNPGDNLRLDTLVTTEVGALQQSITFTVGSGVQGITGEAVWEINTPDGTGPRLTGVNIDIFDASEALVTSDTFTGTLAGFAVSTLTGTVGPGTYRMVATGTGVRDSSLDVTLSFASTVVPAPATWALLMTGLAVIGWRAKRRPTTGKLLSVSESSRGDGGWVDTDNFE